MSYRHLAAISLACLATSGCNSSDTNSDRLQRIYERGELVVLTRVSPTTFYEGRKGFAGPEYDMVESFAASLGLPVRYRTIDQNESVISLIERGEADLAAAGIVNLSAQQAAVIYGPSYQSVEMQVVCKRFKKQPRNIQEISKFDVNVVAGSSGEERLRQLSLNNPELRWSTQPGTTSIEAALEDVWQGKLGCVVAPSNVVVINQRYFPELEVAMTLGQAAKLAWAMPKDADRLKSAVDMWFASYEQTGALDNWRERYYGFVAEFDYYELYVYRDRIARTLPQYKAMFEKAGNRHGFSWTLLAAQGYQESVWDPQAVGKGGDGLMMLGPAAANMTGVTDAFDPKQSIMGGAEYLAYLYKQLDEVPEPDRTWLALAAYNVGPAHLADARQLARSMNLDPDKWSDIKTVLPYLSEPRYYNKLRYGYARGDIPVQYVQRIRDLEDILAKTAANGV